MALNLQGISQLDQSKLSGSSTFPFSQLHNCSTSPEEIGSDSEFACLFDVKPAWCFFLGPQRLAEPTRCISVRDYDNSMVAFCFICICLFKVVSAAHCVPLGLSCRTRWQTGTYWHSAAVVVSLPVQLPELYLTRWFCPVSVAALILASPPAWPCRTAGEKIWNRCRHFRRPRHRLRAQWTLITCQCGMLQSLHCFLKWRRKMIHCLAGWLAEVLIAKPTVEILYTLRER